MKKNYIQPALEVLTVNATYSICAESTTENLSIVDPTSDPGNLINAETGR